MRTTQQEVNLTSFSKQKPSARRSRSPGDLPAQREVSIRLPAAHGNLLRTCHLDMKQEFSQRNGCTTYARFMAGLWISLTIWRSRPYDATSVYGILMDWVRVMKVRHDGMGIVSLYYSRQSGVLSPQTSP